jgi:hypothetical protein
MHSSADHVVAACHGGGIRGSSEGLDRLLSSSGQLADRLDHLARALPAEAVQFLDELKAGS